MIEATLNIKADNQEALLKALDTAKKEITELSIMSAYVSIDVISYMGGETDSSLTIDLKERENPNVNTTRRCDKGTG